MSIDMPLFKLQDAWRECERHVYHLIHALSAINRFSPLTGDGMDLLTDEQVQDIDQFICGIQNCRIPWLAVCLTPS